MSEKAPVGSALGGHKPGFTWIIIFVIVTALSLLVFPAHPEGAVYVELCFLELDAFQVPIAPSGTKRAEILRRRSKSTTVKGS